MVQSGEARIGYIGQSKIQYALILFIRRKLQINFKNRYFSGCNSILCTIMEVFFIC